MSGNIRLMNVFSEKLHHLGRSILIKEKSIPMGTDCAPLLANLFLFFYEYRYMKGLIKNNIHMAIIQCVI